MPHVADALSKYHCGPGRHKEVNSGIYFSGATAVTPGQSIPDADQPLWACSLCGIDGGFMTCIVCGGDDQVTPQTIRNDELGQDACGELCMSCYKELMGAGVRGWRLV